MCPNGLAMEEGSSAVSLARMDKILDIDKESR